ncbi:MAG: UDP-N-acetylmuramoyl-L-alanine--D-glutamate ligase [Steroidobacteraceae bacterium]
MSQSITAPHAIVVGKRLIVGLGRTGLSVARHLHAQGIEFAVTDGSTAPGGLAALQEFAPSVQLFLGSLTPVALENVVEVIVSPGIALRSPLLQAAQTRGIPIVGDVELFARATQVPIAAITGTNGKSTVTTLLALMAQACGLRAYAGGNLGRPALDLLQETPADLFVLELSSFQLETTASLTTKTSTVLNVSSDHMDRYDSMLDYAQAKARVFDRCATAVINLDDPLVAAMPRHGQTVLSFTVQDGVSADYSITQTTDGVVLCRQGKSLLAMSELKLTGLHNAANALAALAMSEALSLDQQLCLQALRDFPGLPHRAEWVADVQGVRYIEDSKGTNVGATLAAVNGMCGPLIVIAGGQGKGQDFAPLAASFRGKVKHVVLLGQDAAQLDSVLNTVCSTERVSSMEQAVQAAARIAQAGDTVLLSPACASLDMFRDYAHRGAVFAHAVKELTVKELRS